MRRRAQAALVIALALVAGVAAASPAEPHDDPSRTFNWVDGLPFRYSGLDKLGGPLGDGKLGDQPLPPDVREEPMSAPFVLMILNFVVFLVILGKFGGPFARKVAETRSDQIKAALDEAALLRDQAKAKLEEFSSRLDAADAEMTRMLEAIRRDAETDRARVIAAAEAQAAAMKKDAEERIAAEIELARYVLAREVATAASAAAATLLRDKATAADQIKLVDTFITEVGTGGAPRPQDRT